VSKFSDSVMSYVLELMLSSFNVEYSLIKFSVDSNCIRCLSSEYTNVLRTISVLIIRELTTLDICYLHDILASYSW